MSDTVKLAIFPPWKAPVPYETLPDVFATMTEAARTGERAIGPVTGRELAAIAPDLQPRSERLGEGWVTAVAVPSAEVHGFLIYDEAGVEVGNWTTLDVAVERAAEGEPR